MHTSAAGHDGEEKAFTVVWLWDAGNACGVTGDEARARAAAAACLRADGAQAARVEKAFLVPGKFALSLVYDRTEMGWSARRRGNGQIIWRPLPAPQDLPQS